MKNKHMKYDIIGYMMLFTLFFSMIISGILWWFDITIQPFIFPLSCLLSIFFFSRFLTQNFLEIFAFLALLSISILLNWAVPDMSWDGQAYHQPMVYALAKGWNPIIDSHNHIIDVKWGMNIWIDHYLKGWEISAATLFSTTGVIETGKTVNTMLMTSVLMISIYILNDIKIVMSTFKRVLYVIILGFPVVFVNYGFTFYIDVATYYLVFWIFALLYLIEKSGISMTTRLVLFVVVFMGAAIKWNIFFWICYFVGFYCLYQLYLKKYKILLSLICTSVCSLVLVLMTVIYNPFVTNVEEHGNPFYPIGTEMAEDIGNNALPKLLKDKNRFSQVLISLFSRPNDNSETPYLNPYHISYRYNIRSLGSGAKIGGGGLFFIEVFIISLVLLFVCKNERFQNKIFCITILFLFSLFILPMGSNYRYIPFISLLPIFLLLYAESIGSKCNFINCLKVLCMFFLSLNTFVGIPFFIKNTYLAAKNQSQAIEYIKNIKHEHPFHSKNWSFNYKMNGNNIPYDEIFSNNNDDYYELPNQQGPPIFLYK